MEFKDYSRIDVSAFLIMVIVGSILLSAIIVDKIVGEFYVLALHNQTFFVFLIATIILWLIKHFNFLPWMTLTEKQEEKLNGWRKSYGALSGLSELSVIRVTHYRQAKKYVKSQSDDS